MSVQIEVSFGELLDKITILEIKRERIADPQKLANVMRELASLSTVWAKLELGAAAEAVGETRRALREVNERLWVIEDDIRELERQRRFDADFIALARSVYQVNDQRARHKRRVDELLGSRLVEEKSYAPY
jgi:vacuolar-type H+-ATPase subunit I/STV1